MDDQLPFPIDLEAYCRRIGHQGRTAPDLATLEALHVRHAGAIPFENLDPLRGLPVRLDPAALQAKLVAGGRGGYCFEHNTLFAAVLQALGFRVSLLEARVRWGAQALTGRTHGILRVELDGRSWLADVGFGGEGLLGPVPLDGEESVLYGERRRVLPEGGLRVLQVQTGEAWKDYYSFALEEAFPVDWKVANHYTGTHPDSRFTRVLTAQLASPERRLILRDRTLTEVRAGIPSARELEEAELLPALRSAFGLNLPSDFNLPPRAGQPLH